jgi:hypothetical protein
MTISEAIDRVFARLSKVKNTYTSYSHTLEPFRKIFGDCDCSEVTIEDIKDFISNRPRSEGTKHLRFSHVKAVFDEAQQALIESGNSLNWGNPCLFLKEEFKVPKNNSKNISETFSEDMRRLKKTLKPKYQLIYEIGTKMGLRVSEILSIIPLDLIRSGDDYAILIQTQNNQENKEVRRISPDLYQKLLEYIDKKGIKENDRIFPITRQAVNYIFKKGSIKPSDLRLLHLETKSLWMSFYLEPITSLIEHSNSEITTRYTIGL